MTSAALLFEDQIIRYRKRWRWHTIDSLARQNCWLIIDAPDEIVQRTTLPKIGYLDRRALMLRRLDEACPGMTWRTARMSGSARAPVAAIFALPNAQVAENAARALAAEGARLAGALSTSAALWLATRKAKAPLRGVFLAHGFRLLACDRDAPLLTRLIPTEDLTLFLEELKRTRTYLQRQRTMAGVQSFALHCYGTPPAGWKEALSAAWAAEGGIVWHRTPAHELLLDAPRALNLAPAEFLRTYRAYRLGQAAVGVGLLSLAASFAIGAGKFSEYVENEKRRLEAQQEIARLTNEKQRLERRLTSQHDVTPEELRLAAQLEALWQAYPRVTVLVEDLRRLSQALDTVGVFRVHKLEWQATETGGCNLGTRAGSGPRPSALAASTAGTPASRESLASLGTTPAGAQQPTTPPRQESQRTLRFELRVVSALSLREKARDLEAFSRQLRNWPGAVLAEDPSQRAALQALSSDQKEEDALTYCMQISTPLAGDPQRMSRLDSRAGPRVAAVSLPSVEERP